MLKSILINSSIVAILSCILLSFVDFEYITHHSLVLITQYALKRNINSFREVEWCNQPKNIKSENIFELNLKMKTDKYNSKIYHKQKGKDPNILLIIADDLGYNDLHGMGIHTKHIQSIYNNVNGVDFTRAYAGHATCSPSRASLLTGVYSPKFGYQYMPLSHAFAKLNIYEPPPYPHLQRVCTGS